MCTMLIIKIDNDDVPFFFVLLFVLSPSRCIFDLFGVWFGTVKLCVPSQFHLI